MASIFGRHIPGTKRVSPTQEVGQSGTAVFGGYVEVYEKNNSLSRGNRYKTGSDILANISIVAASVRYFLNILSEPKWSVEPVDDSEEAKKMAEFVENVIHDMDSPWAKVLRRSAMYKFWGFSIQEWTAKKRIDGLVGLKDIESRPQHTIEKWERDDMGTILGVHQRSVQSGLFIPIDRWKLVYMVDDMLTDSPEGMGWFRHLAEPWSRLKEYLALEKIGFERDLAGTPVGRAPITDINKAVKKGSLTQAQATTILNGLTDFVKTQIKKSTTGIVLDSQMYTDTIADGTRTSGAPKWGIELLQGDPGSLQQLGDAIQRIQLEMARIMGTEAIMMGADGKGSLALSKDKSSNLYIQVNSTINEMAEQFNKDIIDSLWWLNGFDEKLKPKFKVEDVTFHTIEEQAAVLADLARAGAMLSPYDDAIQELYVLLGLTPPEKPDDAEDVILPQATPPQSVLNEGMDQ